jgi:Zn finger protein HypA/HybF involved in hydrogenase expression
MSVKKKVYVWRCSEHGEMELLEELTEAFCPKCGKLMTKVGEYEE